MEGPHTQRENRHIPPSITALFPPANRTLCRETVPSKGRDHRPAAFVSALKLWYLLFHSEQVAYSRGSHCNPGFRQYLSQHRVKAQKPFQPRPAADAGSLPQGEANFC